MWLNISIGVVTFLLFYYSKSKQDKSTQTDVVITEMILQTLSDEASESMSVVSDSGSGVIMFDHF